MKQKLNMTGAYEIGWEGGWVTTDRTWSG